MKANYCLNVNTNGNKKLVNSEKIRFIIWNLPAVKTCPFRTPMCEKSCYARKAERVYPQVLPSREKNYADSLESDFVNRMIYTIEKELDSKKAQGKLTVFRIHESGDFYNLEYTKKWIEIAKHFENDKRIIFLAYTKSIEYIMKCGYNTPEFPRNFVVRSSLWKDTTPELVNLTVKEQFPIYTALTMPELVQVKHKYNAHICKCENCANCRMCWNSTIKNIICEIH